jgi:MFS family permease
VSAHFLVMGLTGGIWMARVPSAKSQAHLSDGTLGLALFALPIGLMLGAALAERLVDRVGSAVLCRITGVGSCAATVTPGLAHSLPALLPALFAMGFFGGTLDVSQNAQGVRIEAGYGRPVMTSMHAGYSLGVILGSLAGSAFAGAGVALLPSLAVVGAIGALIDGAAGPWLLPGIPHPATHEPGVPGGAPSGYPGPNAAGDSAARKRVRRLVLALAVLGVCGLVAEGSAGDWSAVYLQDNLGARAAFAALGLTAFSVTMTLGRGLGDRLIHRFGVVPVIRVCGVLATIGLACVLATPFPGVAIVGFTVFGAGLSIVIPQVFAAGGRADPFRPGSGLARVVGLGYTGMAAGPALIGLVADKIGLHLALVIPLALVAWIAVAAPVLRPPQGADQGRRVSVAIESNA